MMLPFKGKLHRFGCIGYTRSSCGAYWDKSSKGIATMEDERGTCRWARQASVRVLSDSATGTSPRAGGHRAKKASVGTPRTKARTRGQINERLRDSPRYTALVEDVAKVVVTWGTATGALSFAHALPPAHARHNEWVDFAIAAGLSFDQAHRPQVAAFGRWATKHGGTNIDHETLAATMQAFALCWVVMSASSVRHRGVRGVCVRHECAHDDEGCTMRVRAGVYRGVCVCVAHVLEYVCVCLSVRAVMCGGVPTCM